METRIYNLIILDESGSMGSIKREAIGGFNETVQTIKKAKVKYPEQDHRISLVTFNGADIKTVYDKADADRVDELTDKLYCPSSLTPLYDAMGTSLVTLRKAVKPEDKVLVTIITDGEENASREYTGKAIKSLVEELKSDGWVFTYIGANQDVEKVAATISVTNVMNFEATSSGTQVMFAKESSSRMNFFDKVAQKFSNEKLQSGFFDEEPDKDDKK
ncbi:MAG: VWA domain-containing protein [Tannerella sp.]|jgi:Mg-chelatase subunit ChlD|nr:VWA domain-containing protein [Tannerella sp.]